MDQVAETDPDDDIPSRERGHFEIGTREETVTSSNGQYHITVRSPE